MDNEEDNVSSYLIAVGNVLSKYPELKGQAQFVKKYLKGDGISRDIGRLI